MKLKIAYVITKLNFGGAQTMLVRLLKNIDSSKFEIKLFVCGEKIKNSLEQELDEAGIKVEYLSFLEKQGLILNLINKYKNYKKFSYELKKYDANIIHDHLDNVYSFLYCILNNKKLVFTIHSWPDRLNTRKMRFFIKKLLKKDNLHLIGVAEAISNRSIEIFSCHRNIVTTIYNPVELEKYKKTSEKINTFNKDNIFNYIHIGRLTPIKNQKLLVKAFAKLLERKPNSYLTIVGDGNLRKDLEKQVKDLNISNNILFLGERYDIPELLSRSDAFVLTSNSEALPMTILEAMASGKPVIATKVGGILEQVGSDILLSVPQSIESVYEKLLIVQESEKIYKEVVRIQNISIKKFSINKVCKDHEKLYKKIFKV